MKKLIKQCKEFVEENPTYYGLELSVSDVKLIVEALEKQIPKNQQKTDGNTSALIVEGVWERLFLMKRFMGCFFVRIVGKR